MEIVIPKWKRPTVREYLYGLWDTEPTDQDLEMLKYLEKLEQNQQPLDKVLNYCDERLCKIQTEMFSQDMDMGTKMIVFATTNTLKDVVQFIEKLGDNNE